ncbi:MAG: hypothetical protein PHO91_02620 [Patescibacteria group bacterium]|nr:hypothetical protein [Patescibacteria group bacterium]
MKKKSETGFFPRLGEKALKFFLDCVFPQFCLGCKKEGEICCQDCLAKLDFLPLDPWPWPEEKYCFDACYICLAYENKLVEKLIKNYKYKYLENLADTLADILYQQVQKIPLDQGVIISNVPLHSRKKKKRGFDQTELLAKKLAQKMSLKYQSLLVRQKNTQTQAELSKDKRQKNMANAFGLLNSKKIKIYLEKEKIKTIILIDDIATTGSTFNEASKTISQKFDQKIICLALAKN